MAKLFSFSDIDFSTPKQEEEEEEMEPDAVTISNTKSQFAYGVAKDHLQKTIGEIEPNQSIHFVTPGAWSMHEAIEYCLRKTGPAKLYLTTWTISETPARMIYNLKNEGLITELHALFDHRIRDSKPKPFQMITAALDSFALVKIHAKTAAIINDDWGISIAGSANLTKNPRIERGIIDSNRPVAEFDANWITKHIQLKNERDTNRG